MPREALGLVAHLESLLSKAGRISQVFPRNSPKTRGRRVRSEMGLRGGGRAPVPVH